MKWSKDSDGFTFQWNLSDDAARLIRSSDQALVWHGSLLPALLLAGSTGGNIFIKAKATAAPLDEQGGEVPIEWERHGSGRLVVQSTPSGVCFRHLSIEWNGAPQKVVALYFGTREIAGAPRRDEPFWPDWQADGICVPSAKGAPPQSFFRFWDLGQANLALGSFGPAGTPYAAAFPRPIHAAAMGGSAGWFVAGPGAIPDGELHLNVVAGAACLRFLHREDLWGPREGTRRNWDEPLRLAWAASAWEAYRRHFASFDPKPVSSHHQRSSWNSWSEYRQGIYENQRLIRTVYEATQPELFTFDEGWESGSSSGEIRRERFPEFEQDLELVRKLGMDVGLWQAVGWIEDPAAAGLGPGDLLCGPDGVPCKTNWLLSPHIAGRFGLDPSSPKTREFIRKKTRFLVGTLGAKLLKLDFGYGLPSLESAAPRDPSLRGERLASTLYNLMAGAAREIDPDITLQGWGLSPLQRPAFNLIAMDDVGDCGADEAIGHRHWSVWAALIGDQGMGILSSSGYDWGQDAEVLLDTAVLGSPGAVLAMRDRLGDAPPRNLAARRAVHRWFRRSVKWSPLWLNSETGCLDRQPMVKCWGRLEASPAGVALTALALRDGDDKPEDLSSLGGIDWTGRWAIISQNSEDLFSSVEVACIPFDDGLLRIPASSPPSQVISLDNSIETEDAGWQWADGFLTLDSSGRGNSFSGFLIRR